MASQGKGSRRKGNRFENITASVLSILLFNREDFLVRSPRSGGGPWEGDIVPNPQADVTMTMSIECKNNESWDFKNLIEFNEPFREWIFKLKNSDRAWILTFTRNFYGIYLLSPLFNGLSDSLGIKIYNFGKLLKMETFIFLRTLIYPEMLTKIKAIPKLKGITLPNGDYSFYLKGVLGYSEDVTNEANFLDNTLKYYCKQL